MPQPTKCFYFKYIICLDFHRHHKKPPVQWRASWRKARVPRSEEGQTRERGPHRPTCEPVLVWNWSALSPKHTKPKSLFYRNHKLSNRISVQLKAARKRIKAGTDVWRCDAVQTWVDLRCGDPKQVEEGEEEEVSVPQVLHPKHTHWDRLWIWNTRQTQQVTLVCSATSRMPPPRSRFVFNLTVCIHGNQTFVGIHTHTHTKKMWL